MKSYFKVFEKVIVIVFIIVFIGYLLPGRQIIPVKGASKFDWNQNTFWFYPWGESGVHKGIDIFHELKSEVIAPVSGFVIKTGYGKISGYYIYLLGPKWRIHYFAHLNSIFIINYKFVKQGELIALVGNSGNGEGKSPHLHYSIVTPFPYVWLYENSNRQGWKKMFYLNPQQYLL